MTYYEPLTLYLTATQKSHHQPQMAFFEHKSANYDLSPAESEVVVIYAEEARASVTVGLERSCEYAMCDTQGAC